MYYYKATLRLSGSTNNEVDKIVSAPEFLVLQYIHGVDCFTRVSEIKNERVDSFGEKKRLKSLYEMALVKRDQSVDNIFGALGVLPERLPDHMLNLYSIDPDKVMEQFSEDDIAKIAKSGEGFSSVRHKNEAQEENENKIKSAEEVNVADLFSE
jgi:hypothetical protein